MDEKISAEVERLRAELLEALDANDRIMADTDAEAKQIAALAWDEGRKAAYADMDASWVSNDPVRTKNPYRDEPKESDSE